MKRTREVKPRRQLPSWVALVVVLATAFATGWGMLKTARGRGWTATGDPSYLPLDATRDVSPGIVAMENGGVAVAGVAGATAPPTIVAGVSPRHEDRGTCTSCHSVVSSTGVAVPSISALAAMPHEYRGMCTNCHAVVAGGAGLAGAPQTPSSPGQQIAWPTCPGGQPYGAGQGWSPPTSQPGGVRQF